MIPESIRLVIGYAYPLGVDDQLISIAGRHPIGVSSQGRGAGKPPRIRERTNPNQTRVVSIADLSSRSQAKCLSVWGGDLADDRPPTHLRYGTDTFGMAEPHYQTAMCEAVIAARRA
jgi:hypothetical protein